MPTGRRPSVMVGVLVLVMRSPAFRIRAHPIMTSGAPAASLAAVLGGLSDESDALRRHLVHAVAGAPGHGGREAAHAGSAVCRPVPGHWRRAARATAQRRR